MYKNYQDEQFYTNGIQKKVEWLISNMYPNIAARIVLFVSDFM